MQGWDYGIERREPIPPPSTPTKNRIPSNSLVTSRAIRSIEGVKKATEQTVRVIIQLSHILKVFNVQENEILSLLFDEILNV